MRALLAVLLFAPAVQAQLSVGGEFSVGPSLTSIGASGTIEATALGVPLPVGRVDFPTAVGLDARARLDVGWPTWGGRLGVGYLSASDVFDGASIFDQRSVDVEFAVASAEVRYRAPLAAVVRGATGGDVVLALGPEVRVILDEGTTTEGLLGLLGDVRQSHLAVGGSLGARFEVGGLVLGPELRGGLALTPLSDDRVNLLDGAVRLSGDFRFNHASLSLTVGME